MTRTSLLYGLSCAALTASLALVGCGGSSNGGKDAGGGSTGTGGTKADGAAGSGGTTTDGGTGGSAGGTDGGTGGSTGGSGGSVGGSGGTTTDGGGADKAAGGTGGKAADGGTKGDAASDAATVVCAAGMMCSTAGETCSTTCRNRQQDACTCNMVGGKLVFQCSSESCGTDAGANVPMCPAGTSTGDDCVFGTDTACTQRCVNRREVDCVCYPDNFYHCDTTDIRC